MNGGEDWLQLRVSHSLPYKQPDALPCSPQVASKRMLRNKISKLEKAASRKWGGQHAAPGATRRVRGNAPGTQVRPRAHAFPSWPAWLSACPVPALLGVSAVTRTSTPPAQDLPGAPEAGRARPRGAPPSPRMCAHRWRPRAAAQGRHRARRTRARRWAGGLVLGRPGAHSATRPARDPGPGQGRQQPSHPQTAAPPPAAPGAWIPSASSGQLITAAASSG